jgi:hypothetical protein
VIPRRRSVRPFQRLVKASISNLNARGVPLGPKSGESSGRMSGGEHAGDWKRQVSIAGIGLTLGLVLVLATAAIRRTEQRIRSSERRASRGHTTTWWRSVRGSREFPTPYPAQYPTPGTPKLTCLDDYATRHTEWCQDWVTKLIRRGIRRTTRMPRLLRMPRA